jgi:hypothetical protein
MNVALKVVDAGILQVQCILCMNFIREFAHSYLQLEIWLTYSEGLQTPDNVDRWIRLDWQSSRPPK